MNRTRLKEAEERFLMRYPEGFASPPMIELAKKHKVEKMKLLAKESFAAERFADAEEIALAMAKVVAQSTLVSVFEKPKFRDLVKGLTHEEKIRLAGGLGDFLHGDQAKGFRQMTELLHDYRLAKWPLLTVFSIYYRPDTEVFVKPTTAKAVIKHFELTGLRYDSYPSFEFYQAYREQILKMKMEVDASLQVDNAAFCGFLMMAIDGSEELD